MGGKRPDQYRIAPDETLATDYKNFLNEPDDLNAQRIKPHGGRGRKGIDFEDLDSRVLKGGGEPEPEPEQDQEEEEQ